MIIIIFIIIFIHQKFKNCYLASTSKLSHVRTDWNLLHLVRLTFESVVVKFSVSIFLYLLTIISKYFDFEIRISLISIVPGSNLILKCFFFFYQKEISPSAGSSCCRSGVHEDTGDLPPPVHSNSSSCTRAACKEFFTIRIFSE